MLRRYRVKSFGQLLLVLIVVTLAQPFLSQHRLLQVFLLLVLLDGIYIAIPADVGRHFRRAINILWALAVVFVVAGLVTDRGVFRDSADIAGALFQTTLFAICLATTLLHVLRERSVTLDMIFAAMAGYFFIVSTFTGIYLIATILDPAALHYPSWIKSASIVHRSPLSYFSFVTAASLGYGDIVPVNPYVQMLAAVEVVLAQFYLATIIARLVSLYKNEPASE